MREISGRERGHNGIFIRGGVRGHLTQEAGEANFYIEATSFCGVLNGKDILEKLEKEFLLKF